MTARWRTIWLVTLGVLVWRVLYLIFWCPYELLGDEAQYWVWSRHLDLSYYSKGPGVAWAIAASTRLLGNAEWAIRLPAAVAGAVTMLALAQLGVAVSGDVRVGLAAAVLFCFVPGYWGMAQWMTIDAPYVACWVLAVLAYWHTRRQPSAWFWLGLALGVGFLFKYTILLLLPGLVVFDLLQRRPSRGWWVTGLVFLVTISPVVIWNQQHGWPTWAHLLGHLHVPGGDVAKEPWKFETLDMIGSQIGIIGPLIVLMVVALWRDRRGLLAWCAVPTLVFYLLVSFKTKVQANWLLAAYTTLLVLVAQWLMSQPPRWVRRVTWFALGYGGIALVVLSFPMLVTGVPVIGKKVPVHRLWGQRAFAEKVQEVRDRVSGAMIVAASYQRASLLNYYLPDQPPVFSAASRLGGRRSSHDFFADTDLRQPALAGRPAVLVGADPAAWQRALRFDRIEEIDAGNQLAIGYNYRP